MLKRFWRWLLNLDHAVEEDTSKPVPKSTPPATTPAPVAPAAPAAAPPATATKS